MFKALHWSKCFVVYVCGKLSVSRFTLEACHKQENNNVKEKNFFETEFKFGKRFVDMFVSS